MSLLFRKLAGYAVRKIASDPVARQQVATAARHVGQEVKTIVTSENKAYEAGRSLSRGLRKISKSPKD